MRPKAESTITSQKLRANNLIVLVEFLVKFPSKNDFNYFQSDWLHALENLSGVNCQFDNFQLRTLAYQFLSKISTFFNSRNCKYPPFSPLRNFVYLFVSICYFKTSEKRRNVGLLSTKPNHCTLTADSVQWLSQSNCSIFISVLVEFY